MQQQASGLRDAESALRRSKSVGATAAAYTPIVARLRETFGELRAEDHFAERFRQILEEGHRGD